MVIMILEHLSAILEYIDKSGDKLIRQFFSQFIYL